MGVVWRDLGEINKAISAYERAVETLPEYPRLWFALGNLYYERGLEDDLISAITSYTKGLELAPDEASAWSDLGSVYYKIGNLDTAINNFQKALAVDPKYFKAWFNLGNVYYKKYLEEAVLEDDVPEYKSYALWCFHKGAELGDKDSLHNEQLLLKQGVEAKEPPLIMEDHSEDEDQLSQNG